MAKFWPAVCAMCFFSPFSEAGDAIPLRGDTAPQAAWGEAGLGCRVAGGHGLKHDGSEPGLGFLRRRLRAAVVSVASIQMCKEGFWCTFVCVFLIWEFFNVGTMWIPLVYLPIWSALFGVGSTGLFHGIYRGISLASRFGGAKWISHPQYLSQGD